MFEGPRGLTVTRDPRLLFLCVFLRVNSFRIIFHCQVTGVKRCAFLGTFLEKKEGHRWNNKKRHSIYIFTHSISIQTCRLRECVKAHSRRTAVVDSGERSYESSLAAVYVL